MQPLVSVIMPTYNYSKYLRQSITSILLQSYDNFEFIIINDGSTDDTRDIILSFANKDDRIVYLENETNRGIPYSLNKALDHCKGDFIARMDSDDIAFLDALEVKLRYMIQHPEVDMLGTNVVFFAETPDKVLSRSHVPLDYDDLKTSLLFTSLIYHPTILVRRQVFDKHRYDENFPLIEDYKLFIDCCDDIMMVNMQRPTLYFRKHEHPYTDRKVQRQQGRQVRHIMNQRIGADISEEDMYYFYEKTSIGLETKTDDKTKYIAKTLIETNDKTRYVNPLCLRKWMITRRILTFKEITEIDNA